MSTIAAIHTGLSHLGIEGEVKRDLYLLITGKSGLTTMSATEMSAVLAELHRLGFKTSQSRSSGRKVLSGKYAHKLQALWIAGYNLGVFRKRDDAALEAFVKRQTGLERERFLHHGDDAARVIEALKGWLAREGGVDWTDNRTMPAWQRKPGYRIALAQWGILAPAASADFWPAVTDLVNEQRSFRDMSDAQWITVMNALGHRVRAVRAKGGGR